MTTPIMIQTLTFNRDLPFFERVDVLVFSSDIYPLKRNMDVLFEVIRKEIFFHRCADRKFYAKLF